MPSQSSSRFWPRETIGQHECPLFYRWTLARIGSRKVMLHHFLPNREDVDAPHDHPWSFLTFVLRGRYDDMRRDGRVETLRAPAVRFRHAEHAHQTRTGDSGAWTLVVSFGGKGRRWGFWRDGRWWHFTDYEREFGFARRCEDVDV